MTRATLILACLVSLRFASLPAAADEPSNAAERRAVEFLAREVPKWRAEHNCFSCHNNGDAARALFTARRVGLTVDAAAITATLDFLREPESWKENGPEGEFSDNRLAAVQFAFALAAAADAELVDDDDAVIRAAELVAAEQDSEGSWSIDADSLAGSPVTYGRALATAASRRVLHAADRERFRAALDKADAWMQAQRPKSVLDAAAVLIGLASVEERGEVTTAARRHCRQILRGAQASDGGWGPFISAPPEVFDTAVVLLALKTLDDERDSTTAIQRGRAWLKSQQLDDGSWPGTTRPSGGDSYAQAISTTAWATMALLETGEE